MINSTEKIIFSTNIIDSTIIKKKITNATESSLISINQKFRHFPIDFSPSIISYRNSQLSRRIKRPSASFTLQKNENLQHQIISINSNITFRCSEAAQWWWRPSTQLQRDEHRCAMRVVRRPCNHRTCFCRSSSAPWSYRQVCQILSSIMIEKWLI